MDFPQNKYTLEIYTIVFPSFKTPFQLVLICIMFHSDDIMVYIPQQENQTYVFF